MDWERVNRPEVYIESKCNKQGLSEWNSPPWQRVRVTSLVYLFSSEGPLSSSDRCFLDFLDGLSNEISISNEEEKPGSRPDWRCNKQDRLNVTETTTLIYFVIPYCWSRRRRPPRFALPLIPRQKESLFPQILFRRLRRTPQRLQVPQEKNRRCPSPFPSPLRWFGSDALQANPNWIYRRRFPRRDTDSKWRRQTNVNCYSKELPVVTGRGGGGLTWCWPEWRENPLKKRRFFSSIATSCCEEFHNRPPYNDSKDYCWETGITPTLCPFSLPCC